MPFGRSLRAIVDHAAVVLAAFTHASIVSPVERSRLAESLTVTSAFVPLNVSAPPFLPAVHVVPPLVVPRLFLPDESLTAVPVPSLNEYAATSPAGACCCTVAEPSPEAGPTLPAASSARMLER